MIHLFLHVLVLLLALSGFSLAHAEQAVTLETRPGVKQSFLLLEPQGKPVAAVILFAGGGGALELDGTSIRSLKNNFLVRTRKRFAEQGFLVAVVDAPSDRQSKRGMLEGRFRASSEHVTDIEAVINDLRRRADVPVWLVGTSRGTESATHVALGSKVPVTGVVLTSAISERNKNGTAVTDMDLGRLKVPVLIVAHKNDGCEHSPASGAEHIRKALTGSSRVEVREFAGGDTPRSKPCEALSQHGFLGIEREVIEAIAAFTRAAPR